MKVSDKVAVLRGLLDRVRANARESGAVGPPSSGRASWSANAEAAAASMRLAMRPPVDDRWDHGSESIEEEPFALAPMDEPLSPEPVFELDGIDAPSDPLDERRDSGGVLLDLDPGELPEVEPRASIPPLSPPPPSRLRAVDSAANADPEAMRFWLSALTTPKSSPPNARTESFAREASAASSEAHRHATSAQRVPPEEIETEPAAPPSERTAPFADAEGDAVPRAPRVPRWSEPTPTPMSHLSSARSEASSPALVAPASERVGRTTNGARSRHRSMRFRPRAAGRGAPGEGGSRWLRGALWIAAGAALGILALRLPRAISGDEANKTAGTAETRAAPSAPPAPATSAATAATVAPTNAPIPTTSGASPPSTELARAPAVANALPTAPELGVHVPIMPDHRGRLLVRSHAPATVYVNGVRAGATNAAFDVPCGLRHVRLAKNGLPPPGKSFPTWASDGVAVMIPCRAAFEIELETSD